MANNSNQHFVPQFYLRRFSSDKSSVNLLLKSSGRLVFGASIKGQCSKRKFYGPNPAIDNFLRHLETQVSRFLGVFSGENDGAFLGLSDIERLLCFLTTQMHRTPLTLERNAEFEEKLAELLDRGNPTGVSTPTDLEFPVMDLPGMVGLSIYLYPHLLNLELVRLRAPKGSQFVTSDNPVVLYNKAGQQKKLPNSTGLASSGLIIFYPIDEENCIVMFDPGVYKVSSDRKNGVFPKAMDVLKINKLQCLNCTSAVYFKDEDCVNIEELRASFPSHALDHIELNELIETRQDGQRTYFRQFETDHDEEHGTSSMLSISQLSFEAKFTFSFMSYRKRFKSYSDGSSAGFIRDKESYDIADSYIRDLESGKKDLFSLHKDFEIQKG